jgi:hypothetical protein
VERDANVRARGNSRAKPKAGLNQAGLGGVRPAQDEQRGGSEDPPRQVTTLLTRLYCTAFIMSKIGRYIATTMPPTMTPRTTIITGSMRERRADTATSTSSS